MILVTVGTHTQSFDRLIRPMDEMASTIGEEIIIQTGCSVYNPKHATYFKWATSQCMEQLTKDARVVVSHAGSGTVVITLQKKKPLVLVPRRCQYNEHNDDHQLQLAEALELSKRAIVVYEPSIEYLSEAIDKASKELKNDGFGPERLVFAIRTQLSNWADINEVKNII